MLHPTSSKKSSPTRDSENLNIKLEKYLLVDDHVLFAESKNNCNKSCQM